MSLIDEACTTMEQAGAEIERLRAQLAEAEGQRDRLHEALDALLPTAVRVLSTDDRRVVAAFVALDPQTEGVGTLKARCAALEEGLGQIREQQGLRRCLWCYRSHRPEWHRPRLRSSAGQPRPGGEVVSPRYGPTAPPDWDLIREESFRNAGRIEVCIFCGAEGDPGIAGRTHDGDERDVCDACVREMARRLR